MLEAEGDGARIEPEVERVQDRAQRRNGIMRFEQRRDVGRHHGDRVAASDAMLRQRRRKAPAARVEFAIAVRDVAMPHRDLVRIDQRATLEKLNRGKRDVVGAVAVESRGKRMALCAHGVTPTGGGCVSPGPSVRCISTTSIQRPNL